MSIFHWLRGSTDEPQLSPELRRRLDELEEKNRRLAADLVLQEKGLKALELDWQEWFDKFRLMYARLSKRIKDAANHDGEAPESPQDAPQSTIPRAVGYDRPWTRPLTPGERRGNY